MHRMIGWGAFCALVGGGLRIVTAFVPYHSGSALLETAYAIVDLGMLFGLIAVGLATSEALGRIGFAFWAIALAALASIVGPDAQAFGIDFYRLGAGIFIVALGAMAGVLLWRRALRAASASWLAGAAFGLLAGTGSAIAFVAAGVALGAGFVTAGIALRRLDQQPPWPPNV